MFVVPGEHLEPTMSNVTDNGTIPAPTPSERHLVCGSGGSRAVLGSAGTILACHLASLNTWRTIGGVSGGSVPTLLLAAGVHPAKIVRISIETDFSALLNRHGSLWEIIVAYLLKDRNEIRRPRRGVLNSQRMGEFVESIVPSWPENYWTVAVHRDNQWVFTSKGVYKYTRDGQSSVISPTPAPVGIAIRATSAVPGIIDAVRWNGNYLFDGALSMDGRCPVRIPVRHFGASQGSIVACDVGQNPDRRTRLMHKGWEIICGDCMPAQFPVGTEGCIVIKPTGMNFRSLQFSLTLDQKWQAVMSGFIGATQKLGQEGFVGGDALESMLAIAKAYAEIEAGSTKDGELAYRTEALLASQGLY